MVAEIALGHHGGGLDRGGGESFLRFLWLKDVDCDGGEVEGGYALFGTWRNDLLRHGVNGGGGSALGTAATGHGTLLLEAAK